MKSTIAVLAALACTPAVQTNVTPASITSFEYGAPAVYAQWAEQLVACVQFLDQADSIRSERESTPRTFTIENATLDFDALQFRAVPTERVDGTFTCPGGFACYGFQFGPVIVVSAQRRFDRVTIKHELLHYLVASDGESIAGPHGLPWGVCEFD